MGNERVEDMVVIDPATWFARVLRHWKRIVLIALLCGIACGGWAYLKNRKADSAQVETASSTADAEEYYEEQLEEARAALSATQIQKINGLYGQYTENVRQRERTYLTQQNMYIMHMDPSAAASKIVQYSVESNSVDIGVLLANLSISDENAVAIREILGADENFTMEYLVQITKDSGTTNSIVMDEKNYNSIVTIEIIANSEEETDEVHEVVRERLEAVVEELHESYSDFQVREMGSIYGLDAVETVANIQYDLVNRLNNVSNQFVNLEVNQIKNLDDDEKAYFDLLLQMGDGTEQEEEEDGTDEPETEEIAHVSVRKYSAIGMIAGLFLGIFIELVAFAIHRHITLTSDAVPGVMTVRLDDRKERGPLEKWAAHIENPDLKASYDLDAQLEIAASQIRYFADTGGFKKVFLYTDSEGRLLKEAAEGLRRRVEEVEFTEGNPARDGEKMASFLESDGVVLLESAKYTRANDIIKVARMSREKGKSVICSVLCYDL